MDTAQGTGGWRTKQGGGGGLDCTEGTPRTACVFIYVYIRDAVHVAMTPTLGYLPDVARGRLLTHCVNRTLRFGVLPFDARGMPRVLRGFRRLHPATSPARGWWGVKLCRMRWPYPRPSRRQGRMVLSNSCLRARQHPIMALFAGSCSHRVVLQVTGPMMSPA